MAHAGQPPIVCRHTHNLVSFLKNVTVSSSVSGRMVNGAATAASVRFRGAVFAHYEAPVMQAFTSTHKRVVYQSC